jgi:hypothetical protein
MSYISPFARPPSDGPGGRGRAAESDDDALAQLDEYRQLGDDGLAVKRKIREGGLRQVDELYKTPFLAAELTELSEYLSVMGTFRWKDTLRI